MRPTPWVGWRDEPPTAPPRWHIVLVGGFLALAAVASLLGLLWSWQVVAQPGPASLERSAGLAGLRVRLLPETWLLVLVAFASAVGSLVHAITSFVTFVGNRTYRASWGAWYLMRMLVGVSLGLTAYLVTRAGLTSPSASVTDINAAGAAAVGSLTGLFSKQASDKLREVFDVAFATSSTRGDNERADKLDPSHSALAAADDGFTVRTVDPPVLQVGATSTVTLHGQGFHPEVVVVLDGSVRPTLVKDAATVEATVTGDDVRSPRELSLAVFDPRRGALAAAAPLRVATPVQRPAGD